MLDQTKKDIGHFHLGFLEDGISRLPLYVR